MYDRREPKRARQACLNCRKKKARCSGEKPVCAFCARLRQRCTWNDGSPEGVHPARAQVKAASASDSEASLAARVAFLESKIGVFGDNTFPDPFGSSRRDTRLVISSDDTGSQPVVSDLATLPSHSILLSLVDVYFKYCHNQPYAYFHEPTFRQRLHAGSLPEYLLYAFAATACRFSDHEFYRHRQGEAITAYTNASWDKIFQHSFSCDNSLEFYMVQATNMLAVVDFTNGHPKLGWVKFALSTRFAQGLRLNEEPDAHLSFPEQEERRRTFWSVYLIDQLISLGPNRSPSFLDSDCNLHLPCREDAFREGVEEADLPTLEAFMQGPTDPNHQRLDHFAMTIIMASALGRFIRFSLKESVNNSQVPWDPRSKFFAIHSILLYFESLSPCQSESLGDVLRQRFMLDGELDQSRAGHLVFSHVLFHLNHCLLNHPFVLHHTFQRSNVPVPKTFVQEALQRCYSHSSDLLGLLVDGQQFDHLVDSSFYGYCAMASGIIHALYATLNDSVNAEQSGKMFGTALAFLERKPVRWANHTHMAKLLRSFRPSEQTVKALTDPSFLSCKRSIPDFAKLWQVLDYGWLPDIIPESLTEQPAVSSEVEDQYLDLVAINSDPTTSNRDDETADFMDSPIFRDFARDVIGDNMGSFWVQMLGQHSEQHTI